MRRTCWLQNRSRRSRQDRNRLFSHTDLIFSRLWMHNKMRTPLCSRLGMQLPKMFQTSVVWTMLLSIIVSTILDHRCACCGCCQTQGAQGSSAESLSDKTRSTPSEGVVKNTSTKPSGCPHCRSQTDGETKSTSESPGNASEPTRPKPQSGTPRAIIQPCCSCDAKANGATRECPQGSLPKPDCQCEVSEQSGLVGVNSRVCELARWLELQWADCLIMADYLELPPFFHSLLSFPISSKLCWPGISAQILYSRWLI